MKLNFIEYKNDGKLVCDGDKEFCESMMRIENEQEIKEKKWIEWLRLGGIKAAHPNDGWHKPDKETFHAGYFELSYPQFDDGIEEGDMVVLGTPSQFRVVQVKKIKKGWVGGKTYYYNDYI